MTDNVIELDPRAALRRTLAYFLKGCDVQETMRLLRDFENIAELRGYENGLRAARIIFSDEPENARR